MMFAVGVNMMLTQSVPNPNFKLPEHLGPEFTCLAQSVSVANERVDDEAAKVVSRTDCG